MLNTTDINIKELTDLRHHLHSIAELSGEEKKTSDKIVSFLKDTNPDEILTGLGGEGIVARYSGKKKGPCVLIRCELDALPIPEANDFEYVSTDKKTGHKCGHDGHMAIVCGVAKILGKSGLEKGEVFLLFQPAEETGQGAQRVLKDDKFKSIKPDWVFALHNLPGYKKHQIVVKEDTFAAASIGMIMKLKGDTSHAAHPEEGKSPALAMSKIIQDISSIPQFYTSLDQAAKATVIHASLGERAFGTSPGYAEVMATFRTYDSETLEVLKKKAVEIAEGVSRMYELELETEWVESFAPTVNDKEAVSIVKRSAEENSLELNEKDQPFGWSEDFGHFTEKHKGALFGLGAGDNMPALHATTYDFPDEIIETGVKMFTEIICQLGIRN
jgi:amidohydrolase